MKKYLLFVACLVFLLYTDASDAQDKKYSAAERNRLIYRMGADNKNHWSGGEFLAGFDIWIKQKPLDSAGTNLDNFGQFAVYNKQLLGQLYNTAEVELATTIITPENAGKYLYHVVCNDSIELVPWTHPSVFRSNKFISYAYLGKFKARRKIIKLEIYEINNYLNRAVYVYNSDYAPNAKITNVILHYSYTPKLNKKTNTFITDSGQIIEQKMWHTGFKIKSVNEVNYMSVRIKNTLQNNMYHVYLKRTINAKTDTIFITNGWNYDFYNPDPVAAISTSYFNKPGNYEVLIRCERLENNSLAALKIKLEHDVLVDKMCFTVLPGPTTIPLKQVLFIILIILTTGGFMFMMYRDTQKRKLAKEAQNKQIATLQLQSVRAQLNPHFIFNALAGIQNLMNKNEVENANKYLARFARLTRNILDDGNKELTSIEHEISLLTDYLQMEQTRFGFNFVIDIDGHEINRQIEIPAMLLQPFVENAVKHGVSAMKSDGMITVSIVKKESNLLLSVKDNGNGFSDKPAEGMGIKLCEDRIKLLNSVYKNTSILLHKTSDHKGALIVIELKNWL